MATVNDLKATLQDFIVRKLSDRSTEKRKAATDEVRMFFRRLRESADNKTLKAVLEYLTEGHQSSAIRPYKKEMLIAIGAAAIGLSTKASEHLSLFFPVIIRHTNDSDIGARYYACEALYNLIKVTRSAILSYIDPLFDTLAHLSGDVVPDIRDGAYYTNRLLIDVVVQEKNIDACIIVASLKKHIYNTNSFVRHWALQWLRVLKDMPTVNLYEYSADILEGLLYMLSDVNQDLVAHAYGILEHCIHAIQSLPILVVRSTVAIEDLLTLISTFLANSAQAHVHPVVIRWIPYVLRVGSVETVLRTLSELVPTLLSLVPDGSAETVRLVFETNDFIRKYVHTTPYHRLLPILPEFLGKLTHLVLHYGEMRSFMALRWIRSLILSADEPEALAIFSSRIDELLSAFLITKTPEEFAILIQIVSEVSMAHRTTEFLRDRMLRGLLQLLHEHSEFFHKSAATVIAALCKHIPPVILFVSTAELLNNCEDLGFRNLVIELFQLVLLASKETAPLRQCLRGCLWETGGGLHPSNSTVTLDCFVSIQKRYAPSASQDSKSFSSSSQAIISVSAQPETTFAANSNTALTYSQQQQQIGALDSRAPLSSVVPVPSTPAMEFQEILELHPYEIVAILFQTWLTNPTALLSLCFLTHATPLAMHILAEISALDLTVGLLIQLNRLVDLLLTPVFLDLKIALTGECTSIHRPRYTLPFLNKDLLAQIQTRCARFLPNNSTSAIKKPAPLLCHSSTESHHSVYSTLSHSAVDSSETRLETRTDVHTPGTGNSRRTSAIFLGSEFPGEGPAEATGGMCPFEHFRTTQGAVHGFSTNNGKEVVPPGGGSSSGNGSGGLDIDSRVRGGACGSAGSKYISVTPCPSHAHCKYCDALYHSYLQSCTKLLSATKQVCFYKQNVLALKQCLRMLSMILPPTNTKLAPFYAFLSETNTLPVTNRTEAQTSATSHTITQSYSKVLEPLYQHGDSPSLPPLSLEPFLQLFSPSDTSKATVPSDEAANQGNIAPCHCMQHRVESYRRSHSALLAAVSRPLYTLQSALSSSTAALPEAVPSPSAVHTSLPSSIAHSTDEKLLYFDTGAAYRMFFEKMQEIRKLANQGNMPNTAL